MEKNESALRRRSTLSKDPASILLEKHSSSNRLASQLNDCSQRLVDSVARQNLASAIGHGSGRKSLSASLAVNPTFPPTNVSLHKQFEHDKEYNTDVKIDKNSDRSSFPQVKHIFYECHIICWVCLMASITSPHLSLHGDKICYIIFDGSRSKPGVLKLKYLNSLSVVLLFQS